MERVCCGTYRGCFYMSSKAGSQMSLQPSALGALATKSVHHDVGAADERMIDTLLSNLGPSSFKVLTCLLKCVGMYIYRMYVYIDVRALRLSSLNIGNQVLAPQRAE